MCVQVLSDVSQPSACSLVPFFKESQIFYSLYASVSGHNTSSMISLHILDVKFRTKVSLPTGTPIPMKSSGRKEARETSPLSWINAGMTTRMMCVTSNTVLWVFSRFGYVYLLSLFIMTQDTTFRDQDMWIGVLESSSLSKAKYLVMYQTVLNSI
jgi:hypothetical protein